jgi:arylsulfatase A-like enzyme
LFRASRVSRALALGQQLLERRFGLLFCEDGHPEWYVNSRRVNAGIRRCLQTTSSEPLFMHVHYVEPHWPYLGSVYPWIQHLGRSPENLGRMVSYYDRAIRQVDTAVSDLLGFLDSLGVGQNSLLVITSDHGEEFLDHGGWGHAHDIYQELLCVPLILVFPSALTGGRVIHAASRSIDIAPSVLALLGIPPPPEMEGSSLLPLIRGLERSSRPVISQFSAPVGDPRSTMKRFDALLVGDCLPV